MRKATGSMMALAALVLTAGCTGGPGGPNYPAWVNDGGASRGDFGEVIYGVGTVSNVRNRALARRTSDSRARREVASTLRVNVQGVLKDYMKSVSDGNPEDNEEGQVIEDVARTIVDEVLVGCQVVDRYMDNSSTPPTYYSLARLGSDSVAAQLRSQIEKVNKHIQLKRESQDAHNELDRIMSERRWGPQEQ